MSAKPKSGEPASQGKACFVISPIGALGSSERRHADFVYNVAVVPVCAELGLQPSRSDMNSTPAEITEHIFEELNSAPVCIADLTFLNANVLYELGVRHALQKPVVHIAANGTALPFDNSHQRTIFFDPSDFHGLVSLRNELLKQTSAALDPHHRVSNPFTRALGHQQLATSGDTKDQLMADLSDRVAQLELERRTPIRLGGKAGHFYAASAPSPSTLVYDELRTRIDRANGRMPLEDEAAIVRLVRSLSAEDRKKFIHLTMQNSVMSEEELWSLLKRSES